MEKTYFNSKILLFGEYSIIHHSMGLAVPYPLFQARLVFRKVTQVSPKVIQSNKEIKAFAEYLKYQMQRGNITVKFDMTSLDFDIEQGLYFESTIPQGFGVGSSGALTASLYQRYAIDRIKTNGTQATLEEIVKLKSIFSKMESHFHGSSSGFDPLICYLNIPLLIPSRSKVEATQVPDFQGDKGTVFLLNTNRPRRTEPLVNLFLEKCKNPIFMKAFEEELVVSNDKCIHAFLNNKIDELFDELKILSQFQYTHFDAMIPALFKTLWKQGLVTDDYYLKLCGAGGGGFILGFTRDFKKTKELLNTYQVRMVYQL